MISNYSFEFFYSCPTSTGQLYQIQNWFNPSLASPDYLNACNGTFTSVPTNQFGSQFAKTGVAYTGIGIYAPNATVKEYISNKLIQSLDSGKKYCINIYFSLADLMGIASSSLCVLFSDSISEPTLGVLSHTPQLCNDVNNVISDTATWTLLSWQYIAQGGEKFITIGNFFDDFNTVIDSVGPWPEAYYFIDDVSVYLSEDTVKPPQNLLIPTYIKNEEYFYITGLPANSNLQVYNAIGQLVFKENNYTQKLNTQQLSTGIYFYNLQLPSGEAYRGKVYFER